MKSVTILLACFLLWGCAPQKEEVSVPVNEWAAILNSDLDQWQSTQELEASWEGEVLLLKGAADAGPAWFYSPKDYQDFSWEMEVKSTVASTLAVRWDQAQGYQLSIDQDSASINPTGSIMGLARAVVLPNQKFNEWHLLRVEAAGSQLQVFLDDILVTHTHDTTHRTGKLAVQVPFGVHAEIQIRNMRIKQLPPQESIESLLETRFRSDSMHQWEPFFDEGDLSGWVTTGDAKWDIEENVLQGFSGDQGGFLISPKSYKNFYLKTQFKITKEDNSGIFIRKHPDSINVNLQDAIECNIYDHNGPAHAYSTGSLATHARAWYGMIDYDDWNKMEIFAEDDLVVLYINGKKSSEWTFESVYNKPGQVCLQAGTRVFSDQGSSHIYFKNLSIKSMD